MRIFNGWGGFVVLGLFGVIGVGAAVGITMTGGAGQKSGVWVDSVTGMEFVWVKGGCFQMGCDSGKEYEKSIHEVCLDGFWMGKYEVTQGQWKKIMEHNPSFFQSGDTFPVEQVSWKDIQMCLSSLFQDYGKRFVLPTEAQWEYAARKGGKDQIYSGGDDANRVAWYGSNSGGRTHTVGTKLPNGWGLYDMSGNVREWCQDTYDKHAYLKQGPNDSLKVSDGSFRVNRGGSWTDSSEGVRVAGRNGSAADLRSRQIGVRFCLPRFRN